MSQFIKRNTTGYEDALIREAEGLEALRATLAEAGVSGIKIPVVSSVDKSSLVLTAIEGARQSRETLEMLGEGLARMHQLRQRFFGWETDNYIGLNPQPNGQSDHWGDFFLEKRLEYQVSLIRDPSVKNRFRKVLEQKGPALAHWLNERCDFPSLVHGDLWSGNAMHDRTHPWLIDPAVYFGDREVDLAMTEMFGGFGEYFYGAYDAVFPLSPDYPVKRDIYNLYHYLNHYNLFGDGYLPGCQSGLAAIMKVA